MLTAKEDLKLYHLAVMYPGKKSFSLGDGIVAYGLEMLSSGDFEEQIYD